MVSHTRGPCILPVLVLQVNTGIASRSVRHLMASSPFSKVSLSYTSLHFILKLFVYMSNTLQVRLIFHEFSPNCGALDFSIWSLLANAVTARNLLTVSFGCYLSVLTSFS